jgi:O-methyltransferase involved in polyketide biosynthesis
LSSSDSISPTAHYTGYVWARNGLSHARLASTQGRRLFESLQPIMRAGAALGSPSLESYLLARHRAIDTLLEAAIEHRGVSQVVEVAAGLSPRGWRFAQRYGDRIDYIEADLPAMAARKRTALEAMGTLSEHHRVQDLDALREDGPAQPAQPGSLAELTERLDPGRGLAIITEGLLGYLSPGDVAGLWRRFAATLAGFPAGLYISDLHLGGAQTIEVRAFRVVLSAFVRGRVHLHFADAAQAVARLREAGFRTASVRPAGEITGAPSDRGARLAHILEASTE